MRKSTRQFTLGSVALCLVAGGGWFGYQQLFTKGLDRLSEKVCDGAVARATVIRVLPDSRSAEQSAERNGSGTSFTFSCRVSTSGDSLLSGEVKVQETSEKTWVDFYGSNADTALIRSAADGVEALAQIDNRHGTASVYVPCVPQGVKAGAASESYALVTEARAIGDTRSSGITLRQAVTDFAYQLTKRAYTVGECQTPRAFPAELPRYKAP
ncbi:hypothetical protein AB0N17_35135 [Streptomyces sp. NPDC051133]|uniref:hypothetical protein n=1 Tax=Streptomyces sp. NPDC051133 TaxID=3155521 RepID=UPI003429186C